MLIVPRKMEVVSSESSHYALGSFDQLPVNTTVTFTETSILRTSLQTEPQNTAKMDSGDEGED